MYEQVHAFNKCMYTGRQSDWMQWTGDSDRPLKILGAELQAAAFVYKHLLMNERQQKLFILRAQWLIN